jgi:hypothetical protein
MILTIDDYFSPVVICIGDAACFLWGSYELNLWTVLGHWPLNTEIWVGSWVNPSEICGRQSSTRTGFSPSTCLLSVTFHLCSIVAFILKLFLSEGQVGCEAMGNCSDVSDTWEHRIKKYLYVMVLQRVNIINLCSHPTIKHLTIMFSSQILLSICKISNSSLIIFFIILCFFCFIFSHKLFQTACCMTSMFKCVTGMA